MQDHSWSKPMAGASLVDLAGGDATIEIPDLSAI
jgi:hypothetical protein